MSRATEQSVKDFLAWLSRYSPEAYDRVMQATNRGPSTLSALSQDTIPDFFPTMGQLPSPYDPWAFPDFTPIPEYEQFTQRAPTEPSKWDKVLNTVTEFIPSIFQWKAQSDIMEVQLERAKQGLPPMETSDYAPVIKHQADISPEMQREIRKVTGPTQVLLWGGIGLAAFFLLSRL